MQRLSPDNFGASDNILTKLLQATWWTLVHKHKLEVHGKARREAARRRDSECSRPTAVTGRRRGAATNDPRRRPITARCTAVGLLPLLREKFRLLQLILH